MAILTSVAIALHVLAAMVWVGGMVFAHQFQRPAAAQLQPPQRLALWRATFARFFPAVWGAIAVLLVTGYAMVFGTYGGFANVGLHVHLMHAGGLLMMLLFLHVYFAPYRRLRRALDAGDLGRAAKALDQIRLIVGINMLLGLAVAMIGASGRFWDWL